MITVVHHLCRIGGVISHELEQVPPEQMESKRRLMTRKKKEKAQSSEDSAAVVSSHAMESYSLEMSRCVPAGTVSWHRFDRD